MSRSFSLFLYIHWATYRGFLQQEDLRDMFIRESCIDHSNIDCFLVQHTAWQQSQTQKQLPFLILHLYHSFYSIESLTSIESVIYAPEIRRCRFSAEVTQPRIGYTACAVAMWATITCTQALRRSTGGNLPSLKSKRRRGILAER